MTDLTQIEQTNPEITQDDIYEALKQFLHRKGFLHESLLTVEGWVQSHEDAWKAYAFAKLDYSIHRFVPSKLDQFPQEMMEDPEFPLSMASYEDGNSDGDDGSDNTVVTPQSAQTKADENQSQTSTDPVTTEPSQPATGEGSSENQSQDQSETESDESGNESENGSDADADSDESK